MARTLIVGTRKGAFLLGRRGKGWRIERAALLGDPVSMVLGEADGTLHVAQDLGHFGAKMKRSRDGGASWEERPVPKYPAKPEGADDVDPTRQTPVPWDLKRVWALEASARAGELWCGTIPGALFRSTDGGDSWAIVDALWNHPGRQAWFGGGADHPGIHSVLVDPRDPDVVRIGVSCGGLWITRDAGASWKCEGQGMRAAYMPPDQALNPLIQDPHRVVQCASTPDHLWIQHHNGIFHSTDGGASCVEIETAHPSSFGFAVAVHPEDPGTAWFVPGVKDEKRYPVDGCRGRHSHARRRENLRRAARRVAAGACVRPRVPARARHRCRRRYTRVRQHNGKSLAQRRPGRSLATAQQLSAADLLRAICKLTGARALQPQCRMSALAQRGNNCPNRLTTASPKRWRPTSSAASSTRFHSDVRAEAKRAIVNYLGCALGGSIEPALDVAIETLSSFSGERNASVLGRANGSTRCMPRS